MTGGLTGGDKTKGDERIGGDGGRREGPSSGPVRVSTMGDGRSVGIFGKVRTSCTTKFGKPRIGEFGRNPGHKCLDKIKDWIGNAGPWWSACAAASRPRGVSLTTTRTGYASCIFLWISWRSSILDAALQASIAPEVANSASVGEGEEVESLTM